MKQILASRTLDIPATVEIEVKARAVRVKGPRGTLSRDFKHLQLDLSLQTNEEGTLQLQVDSWYGSRKSLASIRSLCSHVDNLITGVTRGFRYKMRLVYAHFPINTNIESGGKKVELRNFLGEKKVRKVDMLEGVTIARSDKVKDELILEGNNVEYIGRSAALIHQSCLVRKKDIRKFLDGIYVSEKGPIPQEA